MKSFYESCGFLIGFLVLLLIFQMFFGNKFSEYFMLLVLLSMLVVQKDKVLYLMAKFESDK